MPTPTDSARVRAYFAAQPLAQRRHLKQLRTIIRNVVPSAEDAFSYRIPAMRLNGKILVWYAGFKAHISLFPMTDKLRKPFAADLKPYKVAKGTVQFPIDTKLPIGIIKRLVKARKQQLLGA